LLKSSLKGKAILNHIRLLEKRVAKKDNLGPWNLAGV
jgi:hypothetical protein